jgi:hypothetical protein
MSNVDTIIEKLKSAPAERVREVLAFIEALEAKAQVQSAAASRSWDEVVKSLPGTSGFKGNPVEIQRQMRAEWERE